MEDGPSYDVPALRKAVAVLSLMAEAAEPLGVSEIARLAGVPKNMAFRLLVTLADLGWIQQVDSRPRYQLTLAPFRLFSAPVARHGLTTACHEPLRWLHRQCGETVYLGVLHEGRALNVQVIEGTRPLRVAAEVGATFDLHCTAHGKVLLAHAEDSVADAFFSQELRSYTPATLTDPEKLKAHLRSVRERGFALNDEEYGRGMIGLAAPVRDAHGGVAAALGVFTTTMNLTIAQLEREVGPLVVKAAEWASVNRRPPEDPAGTAPGPATP